MVKKKKIKKGKVMKNIELEKIKKIKVRLIGIGGGGGSIVSEIAQRVTGASFFAANTDVRALSRLSNRVKKFSFGKEITNGLGTGMNPSLGAKAAESEKERFEIHMEHMDGKFDVSSEGYQLLDRKIEVGMEEAREDR